MLGTKEKTLTKREMSGIIKTSNIKIFCKGEL